MTPETAQALEASIKHWRDNVEAKTPGQASCEELDCALCGLFFERNCKGCPVNEKTGLRFCRGTPHGAAVSAHSDWEWGPGGGRAHFRAAAQDMLSFLEGLREDTANDQ